MELGQVVALIVILLFFAALVQARRKRKKGPMGAVQAPEPRARSTTC